MPLLHPFDRCGEVSRVPRSAIKFADYNPRIPLTADQRRRLQKGMEKHGLTECLVWNKRTGVLVGGHQRLTILDKTAPEGDWEVPVIIRDLDEVQERELNILLNNTEAQSRYSDVKLGELFKSTEFKLDIESTGFDANKLNLIIPDIKLSRPEVASAMQASTATWRDQRHKAEKRAEAAFDRLEQKAEAGEITPPADQAEAKILNQDDMFYVVAVFADLFQAAKFKECLGLESDVREIDGRVLMQMVGELKELKGKQ